VAPKMADIPTAVTCLTGDQPLQQRRQTTDVTILVVDHPHADAAPSARHNWPMQQAPEPHATSLHMLCLTSDIDMLEDFTEQLIRQAKQLHHPARPRKLRCCREAALQIGACTVQVCKCCSTALWRRLD
jgi:hypothetical protein